MKKMDALTGKRFYGVVGKGKPVGNATITEQMFKKELTRMVQEKKAAEKYGGKRG